MKKSFLFKITLIFFVFISCFLLPAKTTSGKLICKINLSTISAVDAIPPSDEYAENGIYPHEDFIIKI